MPHYLVIAHGIEHSELVGCLQRLTRDDERAACSLLVTATHPLRAMTGQTPELEALARRRAAEARTLLQANEVFPARTLIGDGSPEVAAEDELRARPETYDAIVLCTPRPGLRAWIVGDTRTRIEERAGLPVFHLYDGSDQPWRRVRTARVPRLAAWWERTRFAPSPAEAASSPVPTRRQMVPLVCLMVAYLAGGLALALAVNRGFLLNDLVAFCIYTVIIGGLLLALRVES